MLKVTASSLASSKAHLWSIHALSLVLTLLFLILPGITGPATKLWWVTISYPVPGATGEGLQAAVGGSWKMGGLGACRAGEECSKPTRTELAPTISGSIRSALIYHFAVAAMLFTIAVIEIILIHQRGMSTWRAWTTFFLPICGTLLVLSVMSVDLIIRSRLIGDDGIENVKTGAVFWLSVVAVFTALLWAAAVYRLRQERLDGNATELREAKMRESAARQKAAEKRGERELNAQDKTVVQRLWPWS